MIVPGHPLYVDLGGIDTGDPAMPLPAALHALAKIQAALDERLRVTSGHRDLPCYEPRDGGATCSQCCHESVFLTPLEWLGVVAYIQAHMQPEELLPRIAAALALYAKHRATIDAFMAPPKDGERDHFYLARDLKFCCPLLADAGCTVYPAREILGRVFGQSFNDDSGIYGCKLSAAHFASEQGEITLVKASAWAKLLHTLPLTDYRQVYPWYFAKTYDLATNGEEG